MPRSAALLVAFVLTVTALVPGAMAQSVTFEHAGGNEWWVEAVVTPKPASLDATDANGPWVALEFKRWGEWAGSFRIEAGNQVKFRATYANGTTIESCWFTHPGGIAQCAAEPPAPAPAIPNGSRRLVAMGDTGSGARARANANGSVDDGATAFLGLGDYDYDANLTAWEDALAPLLEMEHHLAVGNHENRTEFARHLPNGTTWSVAIHGARVVGLDSTADMRPGSTQDA